MAVEGGGKIIKFLVLFFNFLFFVLGIVLIGVGAYAEVKFGSYVAISASNYASGSRLLIAVGVIIAVIAFFGCFGAWKESKCMLVIFFALLLVLLILEIASAVLAFKHRDEIVTTLEKDLNNTISNKYGDDKGTTDLVDLLQEKEKCCGILSWRDWVLNSKFNITHVPDSCCETITTGCGAKVDNGDPGKTIHTEGCYTKLETLVVDNLKTVAGIAITILVIQLLGMILSVCLIHRIGKGTDA